MIIDLPLSRGMALKFSSGPNHSAAYPTARIQKGLVLLCDGQDLSEEAVGFGVPIIKRGLQTLFPGNVELYPHTSGSAYRFTARYTLNLEEKIARTGNGIVNNRLIYASKNFLAFLIRRWPMIRGLLTGTSNLLRSALNWQTTYEPTNSFCYLSLTYSIDPDTGNLKVELMGGDFLSGNISEVIVMNEQGAHHFDLYQEEGRVAKHGNEIGCWDEVTGASAAFISTRHKVSFSLPQVNGARLYLGRELIGSRLAWSGFGYTFPPSLTRFNYEMKISRLS